MKKFSPSNTFGKTAAQLTAMHTTTAPAMPKLGRGLLPSKTFGKTAPQLVELLNNKDKETK